MKKKVLIILGILFSFFSYAQDKIYKLDGTEILSKIIEVSQVEIKYKKQTNLDGPLYTIAKVDVLMIIYANGDTEVISKKKNIVENQPSSETVVDYKKLEQKSKYKNIYGKNIFSINLFSILYKDLNISYERFFSKQKLSIKIPIYIGYSSLGMFKNYNTNLQYFSSGSDNRYSESIQNGSAAGVQLRVYPTGEGIVRGFVGIGGEVGDFKIEWISQLPNYTGGYYKDYFHSTYIGGVLDGGLSYQPSKFLNCSLAIGISSGSWGNYSRFVASNTVSVRIGISVGVRF